MIFFPNCLRHRWFIVGLLLTGLIAMLSNKELRAQLVIRPDTVSLKNDLPVYVEPIASDSLASSFLIVIEREVKAHFHAAHTEYVMVVSGHAQLELGGEGFSLAPGDLIYIPQGTPHSVEVIGEEALRVISIQAPEFKGKDRIFVRPRNH